MYTWICLKMMVVVEGLGFRVFERMCWLFMMWFFAVESDVVVKIVIDLYSSHGFIDNNF